MSHGEQRLSVATKTKINAWLRVLPRQNSVPLHELESLFLPLAYGDQLTLDAYPSRTPEFLLSSNRQDLLVENTVSAAWQAFVAALPQERAKSSWQISVHLEKRVPEKTGLGAGSGDAGSMLLALNRLYGSALSEAQLLSIAAGIGSDVPFFVHSGPCIVRGTGKLVDPIPALPSLWCCIALPDFRIDTAQAYAALDHTMAGQGGSAVDPTIDLSSAIVALRTRTPLSKPVETRLNSFEVTLGNNTASFLTIRCSLLSSGAILAGLSGSGSAVFGIYAERAAAETAALDVQRRVSTARTIVAEVR